MPRRRKIGTGLAGFVVLLTIALVAIAANQPWQQIALRIIGSWIAASAILVLALRFVR